MWRSSHNTGQIKSKDFHRCGGRRPHRNLRRTPGQLCKSPAPGLHHQCAPGKGSPNRAAAILAVGSVGPGDIVSTVHALALARAKAWGVHWPPQSEGTADNSALCRCARCHLRRSGIPPKNPARFGVRGFFSSRRHEQQAVEFEATCGNCRTEAISNALCRVKS